MSEVLHNSKSMQKISYLIVISSIALLFPQITVVLHCDSLLWNASSAD
ncbi:MAG: hypothetical protein LW818_06935 [Ignavibacteriae bacterium]|nr:hypothetical protein [Ignavibacteriota bacterium]